MLDFQVRFNFTHSLKGKKVNVHGNPAYPDCIGPSSSQPEFPLTEGNAHYHTNK